MHKALEARRGNRQSEGAGLEASTHECLNKCTHAHTQRTVHTASGYEEKGVEGNESEKSGEARLQFLSEKSG